MLSNWGALNQTEFTESVRGLGIEVHRVRNMLENMLYWATSQMGGIKPNLTHADARVAIEEQLNILKNKASAKNIRFTNNLPEGLSIYADKNHLSIIFRNLVQNAVKFTHQNGEITIAYRSQGSAKQIDIQDNGIGMSDELLQSLFQIGENTSRTGTNLETGTGIGLILAKELIELNDLELEVKSEVGLGTTFSVAF
jgi:signal transduction histidine kinase